MSTPLNGDQFKRTPGVFTGARGEPDPNEYNFEGDWLRDHKRYVEKTNAGESYVDPALSQMKRDAKQRDEEATRPEREQHQQHQARIETGLAALKGMNRVARRSGLKKRRKIW